MQYDNGNSLWIQHACDRAKEPRLEGSIILDKCIGDVRTCVSVGVRHGHLGWVRSDLSTPCEDQVDDEMERPTVHVLLESQAVHVLIWLSWVLLHCNTVRWSIDAWPLSTDDPERLVRLCCFFSHEQPAGSCSPGAYN